MRSRFRSFADVESFVVKVEDFSYWPCGPMDKASVYGTGDCRFESYQGHFFFARLLFWRAESALLKFAKVILPLWRNG